MQAKQPVPAIEQAVKEHNAFLAKNRLFRVATAVAEQLEETTEEE